MCASDFLELWYIPQSPSEKYLGAGRGGMLESDKPMPESPPPLWLQEDVQLTYALT